MREMQAVRSPRSTADVEEPGSFRIRNWNGVAVISAPREVDIDDSRHLRRSLQAAADWAPTVVLDLSATAYFGVPALGVLATMSRKLTAAGGELRVVGANHQTRRCMRITGDERLYRIFGSLPESLTTTSTTADATTSIRRAIACHTQPFTTTHRFRRATAGPPATRFTRTR